MITVLALTRYGRLGASSRMRTLQFVPDLEGRGYGITVAPLYSDAYLDTLYRERRRSAGAVLRCYAGRVAACLTAGRYDLIWLEKEIVPYLPAIVERLLLPRSVPYVVDYDDAIFHRYDTHRNPAVRRVLGRKIDHVMGAAALVTAGNGYLAARAEAAGAKRVAILPTVVDLDRYDPGMAAGRPGGGPVTIGWIGSPSTAHYLRTLAPVFAALQEKYGVRLRFIGSGPIDLDGVAAEIVPWSEAQEARDLATLDIGVMPLDDTPWERGKCGYKLIQYMAQGLPVVASAIGANNDIVIPGETGYLANDAETWHAALETLITSPELRARMGTAGRARVEQGYSRAIIAERLDQLLRSLV